MRVKNWRGRKRTANQTSKSRCCKSEGKEQFLRLRLKALFAATTVRAALQGVVLESLGMSVRTSACIIGIRLGVKATPINKLHRQILVARVHLSELNKPPVATPQLASAPRLTKCLISTIRSLLGVTLLNLFVRLS